MPMIDVYAPNDLFPTGSDRRIGGALTLAVLRAEGVAAPDLPMMFLVQVAKRHGVSEQLIQIRDALLAHVFRQRDGHADEMTKWLNLKRVLPGHGA
jgi:hypothetical protein